MATLIIGNKLIDNNTKQDKMLLGNQEKEFFMKIDGSFLDFITPAQRKNTPFRYKLKKFLSKHFGLYLPREVSL